MTENWLMIKTCVVFSVMCLSWHVFLIHIIIRLRSIFNVLHTLHYMPIKVKENKDFLNISKLFLIILLDAHVLKHFKFFSQKVTLQCVILKWTIICPKALVCLFTVDSFLFMSSSNCSSWAFKCKKTRFRAKHNSMERVNLDCVVFTRHRLGEPQTHLLRRSKVLALERSQFI